MMAGDSYYARTSDHVALGRAIRELRVRRGVSQQVLGFDAGVAGKYLTRIEHGRANMTFATLLAFARTLRVPLGELVEIYERHLAEIDPDAGKGVLATPTAEALAYAAARVRPRARSRGRQGER